ncbi:MAG: hypothetical protein ACK4UN_19205, partial [Limisphaerales bacterium]
KTIVFVGMLAALAVGCDNRNQSDQGGGSGASSVLSAPADYVGAAAKAQQTAGNTVETVALQNAIHEFAGEHGRYPTDLNELVAKKYIKQVPQPPAGMRIHYDSNTGSVKITR